TPHAQGTTLSLHDALPISRGYEQGQLRDTLISNLQYAAEQLKPLGVRVLVEAINSRVDMPGFFLDSTSKALEVESRKKPGISTRLLIASTNTRTPKGFSCSAAYWRLLISVSRN